MFGMEQVVAALVVGRHVPTVVSGDVFTLMSVTVTNLPTAVQRNGTVMVVAVPGVISTLSRTGDVAIVMLNERSLVHEE